MFRIKTDIRQYKCETKDKVEKLIRNWVIRPNDLIYDADGKEWAPIGDHPAFVGLFGILDEQEKNTPDTVVTARSPYAERPEAPTNGAAAAPEEVTRMIGRPTVSDSEADDVRETDVFDQEEIAESLTKSDQPGVPKAPDGVEPIINDGEVTMMTERTLDLLKITDEDEAARDAKQPDSAPADPAEDEADEEITGVRPRQNGEESDPDAESDEAPDSDAGDEDEADADADEDFDDGELEEESDEDVEDAEPVEEEEEDEAEDEDEEVTGVRKRKAAAGDKKKDDAKPAGPKAPKLPDKPTKSKVLESGPKLGRHDLPEELFATNEISSPEVQEQLKRLDELAELSEPSEPTKTEPRPEGEGSEGGEDGADWPARLDEDSGVDEAWDVIAEDLRTTEEMDDGEEADLGTATTEEVDRDDFDEDEWEDDTSEPEVVVVSAKDFVSDGYRIALPFPVRPTADDIRMGMPQGRVSTALKERTFPAPEPKKLNELHERFFDLSPKPPRDHTWVIAAVVVCLLVFVTIVAAC